MENPLELLCDYLIEPGCVRKENLALGIKALADGIGVLLSGRSSGIYKQVRSSVKKLHGGGEAEGLADQIFLDAAALHSQEWNDLYYQRPGHPSAVILPASLDAALWLSCSGEEFLEAYLVGMETASRMNCLLLPRHHERGFHSTCVSGAAGAAAAVGKLLNLSKEKMAHALSLAQTLAGGLRASFGTDGNPLQTARASRDGACAAFWAEEGLQGRTGILTQSQGFLEAFDGKPKEAKQEFSKLFTESLFQNPGLILKKYPLCYSVYQAVDAALQIREQMEAVPRNIKKIICETSPLNLYSLPAGIPQETYAERFSMPYGIAAALIFGRIGTDTFGMSGRKDFVRLMEKCKVCAAKELAGSKGYGFTRVRLEMEDGSILTGTGVPDPDDRIENWSESARKEKFCRCTKDIWNKAEALRVYEEVKEIADQKNLREWESTLPLDKGGKHVRL
ncbi:MAG TPA: MmgE/PrpD family protein [Candidatus Limivivens intestinipullorum]|uniref:MmgE/PrpD family protein n=1 Tax=Candidatus Limivivens intestinipullorum TaxID=2840858 RepID=A0A9D1EQL7_9FIRM|nr:MmgE/PrpD family protein [Candidatus Limivivens intestinipullorum]